MARRKRKGGPGRRGSISPGPSVPGGVFGGTLGERRSHYKAKGRRPDSAAPLFPFLSAPTRSKGEISNGDNKIAAWLGRGSNTRNAQMARRKLETLRNLRRRPAKPALGNGRVQRACRRAFWAHETPSTSDIIAFAYALRLHRGERRNAFNATVRRTRRWARSKSAEVRRGEGHGCGGGRMKYPQTMPMKTTAQIKRNSLPTTGCTNPSRSAGGKRIVTHVLTAAIRPARRLARTPLPFRQKNPRRVERGHHRVDLGLPPFPLAYFLGTSFPGIFGYRDALGSC